MLDGLVDVSAAIPFFFLYVGRGVVYIEWL